MIDEVILNILINQGFAIAVAVYLLWERTHITKQLIILMERLTGLLDKLEDKLKKDNR